MYLYLYALILVFVHKMMYNRSRIRKGEEIKKQQQSDTGGKLYENQKP